MADQIRFGPRVLCQDCLALADYTVARHNEDEFCACGGQWCGCGSCNDTAEMLISGERRAEALGTTIEIGFWCAETGIRQPNGGVHG